MDLTAGVVRILDDQGQTTGAGFVTSSGLIATASHTLGSSKPERVTIVFHANNETREAKVDTWFPPDAEDIAILQVEGALPANVEPVTLSSVESMVNRKVITFGFPSGRYEMQEAWAEGEVLGRVAASGQPVLQVRSSEVTEGFGGSPVWDMTSQEVIGMVVLIKFEPSTSSKSQSQSFFAVPSDILIPLLERAVVQNQTAIKGGKQAPVLMKQSELESGAVEKNVTTDKPVQFLQDDALEFKVYVNALHDFITSQDTTAPLTIGIDGPWGTGKTSLMRMLQNELDHPLNFRFRLALTWLWIKWFILFVLTLPLWSCGKLLLWLENNSGSSRQKWLREIQVALSYDPTVDLDIKLNAAPKHIQFWAKVAAWHCPMVLPAFCPTPTIWFNAWKFDQEEQLWAALAIEVMNQIKQRYSFIGRFIFWLRLTYKRLSPLAASANIVKKGAVPLILALIAVTYDLYLKQHMTSYTAGSFQVFGPLISLGEPLLLVGALVSGLVQIGSIVKDPFQISMKDVIDKPNYKDKVGFLGAFEADFAHIVAVATKPFPFLGWKHKKLVIFIDDLDRCEPPKSVDIIEGINLFLDSERCIFVLGMDSSLVAASIETKYKGLFEIMQKEQRNILSIGRFFLDKIIQVPFQVPPPTKKGIRNLTHAITQRKQRSLNLLLSRLHQSTDDFKAAATPSLTGQLQQEAITAPSPTGQPQQEATALPLLRKGPDVASYALKDVREAIDLGVELLTANPRQLKRFVNLFRLYVYIAREREIFAAYIYGEQQTELTPKHLALWVAWSIRWTEISKYLFDEVQLPGLRQYLMMISRLLKDDGSWISLESAADTYPSEFKKLKTSPKENNELVKSLNPIYEEVVRITDQIRASEKSSTSHWSHLPWEWWLRSSDFLKGLKLTACFWQQPQQDEVDLLKDILSMTKDTFPTNINIGAASNGTGNTLTSRDGVAQTTGEVKASSL